MLVGAGAATGVVEWHMDSVLTPNYPLSHDFSAGHNLYNLVDCKTPTRKLGQPGISIITNRSSAKTIRNQLSNIHTNGKSILKYPTSMLDN